MKKALPYLIYPLMLLPLWSSPLNADGGSIEEEEFSTPTCTDTSQGFTGKVTRDRVRMRLQPTTESPIIREMNRGDMLAIVQEVDDFYAVSPPSDMKGYIYRTLILDGIVEGNRVNVRLAPHLEAPVIAQLDQGQRVEGKISEENAKWLEISTPPSTIFYIASEYIEKVGDANFLARHETRKKEVNDLLNSTYLMSESELQKPFMQMDAEKIVHNYQQLIGEYNDFPEQVARAKQFLTKFNDAFLRKKVEYLEARTEMGGNPWHERRDELSENRQTQDQRLNQLELQLQSANQTPGASKIYEKWVNEQFASEVNARMALWIPVEIAYYEEWAKDNGDRSIQEFYHEQQGHAVALKGVLEAYDRPVRNKPGDYLLVNRVNRLPIAYLYSTQVNLHDKVGQEVTVEAVLRPNNNFAYPAYYVITAE